VIDSFPHLAINEIFYSIQGESTAAGLPSLFVRTAGCPLRCRWCDTEYAFNEGTQMGFELIEQKMKNLSAECRLVELTGGEPLAQKNSYLFLEYLVQKNYEVMLETSGSYSLQTVPPAVKVIMDFKLAGSGESKKNLLINFEYLKEGKDEVKFVVADRKDFEEMESVIKNFHLENKFTLLVSPVFDECSYRDLAEWVLASNLELRLQLQMHKEIWGAKKRGV